MMIENIFHQSKRCVYYDNAVFTDEAEQNNTQCSVKRHHDQYYAQIEIPMAIQENYCSHNQRDTVQVATKNELLAIGAAGNEVEEADIEDDYHPVGKGV